MLPECIEGVLAQVSGHRCEAADALVCVQCSPGSPCSQGRDRGFSPGCWGCLTSFSRQNLSHHEQHVLGEAATLTSVSRLGGEHLLEGHASSAAEARAAQSQCKPLSHLFLLNVSELCALPGVALVRSQQQVGGTCLVAPGP